MKKQQKTGVKTYIFGFLKEYVLDQSISYYSSDSLLVSLEVLVNYKNEVIATYDLQSLHHHVQEGIYLSIFYDKLVRPPYHEPKNALKPEKDIVNKKFYSVIVFVIRPCNRMILQ